MGDGAALTTLAHVAPEMVQRGPRPLGAGALLDRLTHHVNILEMNGESYRLAQSRARTPSETA